jgi:cell wall-associated NlpC family hydrolase
VSDPQPGDVVVNSYHTGIYIGGGQMIHASDYNTGVIISSVAAGMNNNYIFVRY